MVKSDMIETTFDLKKEHKEIQREIFRNILFKKYNCDKNEITFSNNHDRKIDDILQFRKKEYNIEYKMDYRAKDKGNIVFELITFIPEKYYPNISGIRFVPGSSEFIKLIEVIKEATLGKISEAKISRHIAGDSFKYLFSYAISNFDSYEKTKDVNDIYMHLLFRGEKISKFIKDNYHKYNLISTKTKGNPSWFTISMLMSVKEALEHCYNKDSIYVATKKT